MAHVEKSERSHSTNTEEVEKKPIRKRTVIDEQHQRDAYGGFHLGAAVFGWLVTNGMAVLLLALLAAAGGSYAAVANTSAGQVQREAASVGIGSAIAVFVVLVISYFAGGYVAGRMSRFDGAKQGGGVWVLGVVVAVIAVVAGASIGSNIDSLRQLSLPNVPVNGTALTVGGLIGLLATALFTLIAAIAGGKLGERYHRKIDRAGVTRV